MKSFACKDVGIQCDWTTTGNTDEEIISSVKTHAGEHHGIKDFSSDLMSKVKGAIHDVKGKVTGEKGKTQAA